MNTIDYNSPTPNIPSIVASMVPGTPSEKVKQLAATKRSWKNMVVTIDDTVYGLAYAVRRFRCHPRYGHAEFQCFGDNDWTRLDGAKFTFWKSVRN